MSVFISGVSWYTCIEWGVPLYVQVIDTPSHTKLHFVSLAGLNIHVLWRTKHFTWFTYIHYIHVQWTHRNMLLHKIQLTNKPRPQATPTLSMLPAEKGETLKMLEWPGDKATDWPRLSWKTLFSRMSLASVPSSIKSSLVSTPMVRTPEHSGKDKHLSSPYTIISLSLLFFPPPIPHTISAIAKKTS